jgi:hypothetical protein
MDLSIIGCCNKENIIDRKLSLSLGSTTCLMAKFKCGEDQYFSGNGAGGIQGQ